MGVCVGAGTVSAAVVPQADSVSPRAIDKVRAAAIRFIVSGYRLSASPTTPPIGAAQPPLPPLLRSAELGAGDGGADCVESPHPLTPMASATARSVMTLIRFMSSR